MQMAGKTIVRNLVCINYRLGEEGKVSNSLSKCVCYLKRQTERLEKLAEKRPNVTQLTQLYIRAPHVQRCPLNGSTYNGSTHLYWLNFWVVPSCINYLFKLSG